MRLELVLHSFRCKRKNSVFFCINAKSKFGPLFNLVFKCAQCSHCSVPVDNLSTIQTQYSWFELQLQLFHLPMVFGSQTASAKNFLPFSFSKKHERKSFLNLFGWFTVLFCTKNDKRETSIRPQFFFLFAAHRKYESVFVLVRESLLFFDILFMQHSQIIFVSTTEMEKNIFFEMSRESTLCEYAYVHSRLTMFYSLQ